MSAPLPPRPGNFVRAAIERHLAGSAFAWFSERSRPKPVRRGRRPRRLDYGLDKAAPVALLPAALRERLGTTAAVVELTDWVAGKQYWRHGRGMQLLQRGGGGEVPTARYADIQQLVDDVQPRAHRGDWVFEAGGRRLVLRVQDGVARVLAYYRIRH